MRFWGGYSAEMYDLQRVSERQRLLRFAEDFLGAVAADAVPPRSYAPLEERSWEYTPGSCPGRYNRTTNA